MSERDLTSAAAAETTARVVRPVVFVEMEFDDEFVRLWSGIGDLPWDSRTWKGAGELMAVDTVAETTDVRAEGTKVTLNGVDPSTLSTALQKEFQGRPIRIYVGFFDDTNAIVADPYMAFQGRMDQMPIQDGPEKATVAVAAESHLVDLTKSRTVRYTDQQQKELYPGDKGLEFVTSIQEKSLTWGGGG